MRKTSLIKVVLFVIAILANLNYLVFILNPAHADNLGFFVLTGLADTIAIAIFVSTWTTALFYELNKSRYQHEMAELRTVGNHLLHQRVAVLITVVNEDISIVRNTVQSAKNLIGEKAVYLLDDGKKEATQRLARELGVRYITRATNAGYKAGNSTMPCAIMCQSRSSLWWTLISHSIRNLSSARCRYSQTPASLQCRHHKYTPTKRRCSHAAANTYRTSFTHICNLASISSGALSASEPMSSFAPEHYRKSVG
jgi:cellulose synthase/poly-beta-1,6-N-acetylglucosamine synthase-like glycosyltransferase